MGVKPETKVFLKYARKRECWVCSLCDTENEDNKCHLCGAIRQHNSVVKPTWDNIISEPVNNNHNPNFVRNDWPQEDYPSEESGGGSKMIGLVIAWIAIIFIFLLIVVANS